MARWPDGTRTHLVRALVGVGVKAGGTASPDLSSVDAFKRSLLAAKTVSYVDPKAGGTSGTYFEGLLARMGIADQMKPKIVYRTQGAGVADAVATGAAELGITFIAELSPNKGVKIAGPLPNEIQLPTNYVAAIPKVSANQDAARAFIQAMTAPGGQAVFRGAGLQPLTAARYTIVAIGGGRMWKSLARCGSDGLGNGSSGRGGTASSGRRRHGGAVP